MIGAIRWAVKQYNTLSGVIWRDVRLFEFSLEHDQANLYPIGYAHAMNCPLSDCPPARDHSVPRIRFPQEERRFESCLAGHRRNRQSLKDRVEQDRRRAHH